MNNLEKELLGILSDTNILKSLATSERTADIMNLHINNNVSFEDIAKKLNLSKERIRQLYTREVSSIKSSIIKRIKAYDEYIAAKEEIKTLKGINRQLQAKVAVSSGNNKVASASTKLKDLIDEDLTPRLVNTLKSQNVETLEDLMSWDKNDLIRLRNIGTKTLDGLNRFLAKLNLTLLN